MTDSTRTADQQLAALAIHLASRRQSILQSWRASVEADAELTTPSSLPPSQFNDHIPRVLDAFQRKLSAWPDQESAASEAQREEDSLSHGLQRWQQGYQFREVTREWGHLQLCLVDELEHYRAAHPDLDPRVMPTAWRALAELCSRGVSDSATEYFQLQKAEAVGHVRDMQLTLEEAKALDRRRTELFRQAAHDLRGNVGVVRNVTSGLTMPVPTEMRDEFLRLLERSVSSLQSMLDEVLDLARLQAGQELRDVAPIDVAALLRELAESAHLLATERGLALQVAGPDGFTVEGDAVKIRRIGQNLLLNALKYTTAGGVTVGWGDGRPDDPKRWVMWVRDTGPGFHAGPGAPMAEALGEATTEAKETDAEVSGVASRPVVGDASSAAAAHTVARPVHQERGEGIGLSIVKRLCELLDASLEMESHPETGTVFRVVFPRRYDDAT